MPRGHDESPGTGRGAGSCGGNVVVFSCGPLVEVALRDFIHCMALQPASAMKLY